MTIMSLDIAKEHLRVTGADEDVTIALYLSAAEQAAVDFLNRGVFADTTALAAAKTAAPTALNAATVAYDEQIAGAGLLSNAIEKRFSTTAALEAYAQAQDAAKRWATKVHETPSTAMSNRYARYISFPNKTCIQLRLKDGVGGVPIYCYRADTLHLVEEYSDVE